MSLPIPLDGAILISNPRKESPRMALALRNQRRKSRVNAGFPGRASAFRQGYQKFFTKRRKQGASMKQISAEWKKIKATAQRRGLIKAAPKKSSKKSSAKSSKKAASKRRSNAQREWALTVKMAGGDMAKARRMYKTKGLPARPNSRRRSARRNGLALINPMNLSLRGAASDVATYAVGTAAPAVVIYVAMDKITPMLEEHIYSRAADLVDNVPVVGPWISTGISAAPNAITGLAVGAVLGTGAAVSVGRKAPKQVSAIIGSVAALAPVIGFFMDWPSIRDSFMPSAESLAGLGWNPLGALALENMGGLAYEPLGGLAVEGLPFGDALGDGMAYEVAPISATAYTQASLADAAYSGADFSASEGQALLNGTFGSTYGIPPRRQAGHTSGASHLAGRAGHRWGWLINLVGPEKARQIAGMNPRSRTRLIKKLRRQALSTFSQHTSIREVRSGADMAQAHGAASAVSTVGGHAGPSAPGGPGNAYGAALFIGD